MIDPRKAALIIIDMQHGFLDSSSALCVAGAAATVPACTRALNRARELGMPVFHAIREYAADGSDVEAARHRGWVEGGKPVSRACASPRRNAPAAKAPVSGAPARPLRRGCARARPGRRRTGGQRPCRPASRGRSRRPPRREARGPAPREEAGWRRGRPPADAAFLPGPRRACPPAYGRPESGCGDRRVPVRRPAKAGRATRRARGRCP